LDGLLTRLKDHLGRSWINQQETQEAG